MTGTWNSMINRTYIGKTVKPETSSARSSSIVQTELMIGKDPESKTTILTLDSGFTNLITSSIISI